MVKSLCYQVDSLSRAVSHHHCLWRYTFLSGYQLLQLTGPRGRVVVDEVEMFSKMCLQCRMVGMLIDVAAEVHLHQFIIAVNVITMSFYHICIAIRV